MLLDLIKNFRVLQKHQVSSLFLVFISDLKNGSTYNDNRVVKGLIGYQKVSKSHVLTYTNLFILVYLHMSMYYVDITKKLGTSLPKYRKILSFSVYLCWSWRLWKVCHLSFVNKNLCKNLPKFPSHGRSSWTFYIRTTEDNICTNSVDKLDTTLSEPLNT